MATDKYREIIVGALYPKSMKDLQQLIMDCDACAKNYGKKSWLGADKFQPKFEKFQRTIMTCAFSLVEDGVVSDPGNPSEVLPQIDKAMRMLAETYSSWPEAFSFWRSFVDRPRSSNDGVEQSVRAPRNSPRQDVKPEPGLKAHGTSIIACPNCAQKLRIPYGRALDVTCSSCKSQFLVKSSGEIAPSSLQIDERPTNNAAAALERDLLDRDVEQSTSSLRCVACGLERNVSPGAQGFHCAGCKQYNEVGTAAGSIGRGIASAESATPKQVREATICAVIGCNETIPAGRMVCSKHG